MITYEDVKKAHGDDETKAKEVWDQICQIGGFGQVNPNHSGGLDVSGLKESDQRKILALLGAKKEAK